LTKSQRDKLNLPEEQEKTEQRVAAASDDIGQPRAARDFVDLYGFKSSYTPESLKNVQGLPQQIFEYSNNGELKRIGKNDAAYSPWTKIVEIGTGPRWDVDMAFKRVIVHEYNHRTHFERKMFTYQVGENPEHEKFFQDSKKLWKTKLKNGYSLDSSIFDKYYKKFNGKYTLDEVKEMASAYADTIQALSGANYGWGHTKKYMTQNGGCMARMEWFVHSSENYWLGNPIFQFEFPELYEQMNDYYFNMVVEPLTPKSLLK
jgi:hypothetical protein